MLNRAGAIVSWTAWGALFGYLVLYAVAVSPFFQSGLHQLPSESLIYSGHHYEVYGIPYAPNPIDVYHDSNASGLAFLMVCTAPFFFSFVPAAIFRQIIYHWYEDSRNRRRTKTVALVLSLLMLGFNMYVLFKFVGWGVG